MQYTEEILSVLSRLISFQTVSDQSNLDLIDYVTEYCKKAIEVVRLPHANQPKTSLLLRFGPDAPDGIVLSGHTDVVPADPTNWNSNPFQLHKQDRRLYGRGTADMKTFIAIAMVLGCQIEKLKRPVFLALTYDEEVGCLAAPPLIHTASVALEHIHSVIVGEPTELRPVIANKGITEYSIMFTGKSAHSSKPHLGINAISMATEFIHRIGTLADEFAASPEPGSSCDPSWTTTQVGTMQGGTVTNIVPETCRVSCDLRSFHTADRNYFEKALEQECTRITDSRNLPQNAITIHKNCDVPPLEPVENSPALQLAAEITGIQTPDWVPYATEAGQYQSAGYSTVILGPGSIEQAHQNNEWISLAQLETGIKVLERLFLRQKLY